MTLTVNEKNNFCRVFRLPATFSSEFCFGGGIPHTFVMVDWFNPVPHFSETMEPVLFPIQVTVDQIKDSLLPGLLQKPYSSPGTYLVLLDFGGAFTFVKE